ncbi:hypothetical protein F5144DRAFT_341109 [Chaetomium tenue]|uniref:Uncharacterized protein n=1 Tax=Chaetomium tenue TaxID=1854479 RepID=A0ACB7NZ05_9PEZI|nr:hypothetical protein F5144DRAFT_341109 [Chaetomium globosum]
MASRFGSSSLHQRDSRSDLFKGYTGGAASRTVSASPSRQQQRQQQPQQFGNGGGYGYGGYQPGGGGGGGAGSGGSVGASGSSHLGVAGGGGYRPATPNRKGQYSDAVLNELESQNDQQVDGILGKVRLLKDMTVAIGDEIRDSSALAEKMNDGFDQTRLRLGRTMNRMMVMAERTGVGWRVWLAFFAAVIFLFVYVWLF